MNKKELIEAGALMLKQGLSVLPTTGTKNPALKTWKQLQQTPLTEEELPTALTNPLAEAIAIVCGAVSGGLEVIDIDTKYDITGTLEEDLVGSIDPELLDKLVLARTISGGLHIYYRSPIISGNDKLARRSTTEEERSKSPNEKFKVLVETRGEGGYVIAPPSKGYSYIKGSYSDIAIISIEERNYLISLSRSFNEVEEDTNKANVDLKAEIDINPFKEFNLLGSSYILSLLQSRGWSIVREDRERIWIKRAGDTSSVSSANYHKGLNKLYVFSTSTDLPDNKALSNTDILLELECNGDTKELYKKLRSLGYGGAPSDSIKEKPLDKSTTSEESEEEEFNRLLQPLTRDKVIEEVLKEKDNIPTGFYLEDQYKEIELKIPSGALTVIVGRTSHRKTGTMLNLAKQISDRLEGGKILFLSYEESSVNIQLKLLNLIANIRELDPTGELDNKEYIKAYYKGYLEGSKEFKKAEEDFYREYIDTGRIVVQYTNYRDKKLARAIRYLSSKDSYSLVFMDYLQLIKPEEVNSRTRQEQLFNICEELREVAIETRLPLVFGAQFNREVVQRTDLDSSKIREAGDIEQTANLVLGLWDNNFNPDGEKVKIDKESRQPKTPPREDSLYIEVLKGRDIGIGWKQTFQYTPPTGAFALQKSKQTKPKK